MNNKVLLLDSSTNMATVGLLHLAAYLRRNGIEAYCQAANHEKTINGLKNNTLSLLSKIKPGIVGVSIKWFLHIARGLEICKIIKEYDPNIKIVIGGDTASYYWKNFIDLDNIEYIIRGDGELPLLKLCRGEDDIPNCVYKKNGQLIETPFTYVKNGNNSSDIYLSNINEICTEKYGSNQPISSIFIYTGKGCPWECFYCGGCHSASKQIFNRSTPFLRRVEEARKDIIEVKNIVSDFLFDFELPKKDMVNYYRQLWEEIDLSGHCCNFYFWRLPSFDLIDLIANTFESAMISIDVCSLSERHRLYLNSLKIVKPQLMDAEILACFDRCEMYKNIKVELTTIFGMPFFIEKDFIKEEEMLFNLINKYSCFIGVVWGRLHAQPGAPILNNYAKYNMRSITPTFEEFYKNSIVNFKIEPYPETNNYLYPSIYPKDTAMVSKTSKHYAKLTNIMNDHLPNVVDRWYHGG